MIVFSDVAQAFGNLKAQKTRTFLTALGIVFGVGSVIGMMSIGAGAAKNLFDSSNNSGFGTSLSTHARR